MVQLKLQLSIYLIMTMDWYVKEGYIERNKFIAKSIKNHIDYITTEPGGDYSSPTVEVEVQIPTLLAFQLRLVAFANRVSISSIVNEALAFSIPVLLEQNQALEEFRLEVEMTG